MTKDVKKDLQEQDALTVDTPEVFRVLSVTEEGRKYKTTFTKKFEHREKWVKPNPEEIKSFIPGTVEKIMVTKGEEVKEGDELVLYVAMKMHNIIRAPFDGKVEKLLVKEGERLKKGVAMLVIKEKVMDDEKKRTKDQEKKKERDREREKRIRKEKERRLKARQEREKKAREKERRAQREKNAGKNKK